MYGPVHRRRLRPTRGPLNDDLERNNVDATDALLDRARNEIVYKVPFVVRSCEICLQQKRDYILLSLNAALQHARSNQCGVVTLYSCNTCGKTYKDNHAAQCHVPKCKGPPTAKGKNEICDMHESLWIPEGLLYARKAYAPCGT